MFILGSGKILAINCRKVGGYALMAEASIIEISKHCIGAGLTHSPVMVGPLPLLILVCMTVLTSRATHVLWIGFCVADQDTAYYQ